MSGRYIQIDDATINLKQLTGYDRNGESGLFLRFGGTVLAVQFDTEQDRENFLGKQGLAPSAEYPGADAEWKQRR